MKKLFFFLLTFIVINSVSAQSEEYAEVFRYCEQMPEPGYDISKYLSENIVYPDSARKHNIQGRVNVEFVVQENGDIANVKPLGTKKLGYGIEEEAIRVIKLMPRWQPGKQNGKRVKVFCKQPLTFTLEDDNKPEKK
jgi:protein TonB